MIFTIDDSNKQDLQQAFSIELIESGKYIDFNYY